jgi:hypothetical protein
MRPLMRGLSIIISLSLLRIEQSLLFVALSSSMVVLMRLVSYWISIGDSLETEIDSLGTKGAFLFVCR